jgi:hypothetical protein
MFDFIGRWSVHISYQLQADLLRGEFVGILHTQVLGPYSGQGFLTAI